MRIADVARESDGRDAEPLANLYESKLRPDRLARSRFALGKEFHCFRTSDDLDIASADCLAALGTSGHGRKSVAARVMAMQQRRPIFTGIVFIAPMDDSHHQRVKRETLFRQSILISCRPILIWLTHQDFLIDQRSQAIRNDRARNSQTSLEILKPTNTSEAVANNHERPTVAQYGDGSGYGAFLLSKVIPFHLCGLLGNGESMATSLHRGT